jgi:hypothetical protein
MQCRQTHTTATSHCPVAGICFPRHSDGCTPSLVALPVLVFQPDRDRLQGVTVPKCRQRGRFKLLLFAKSFICGSSLACKISAGGK